MKAGTSAYPSALAVEAWEQGVLCHDCPDSTGRRPVILGAVQPPVGIQPDTRTSAGPARTGRLFYGWVLVVMLGITQTITWGILYYGFTVFMPVLEADRGWTRGQQSGAFSIAMLLSGLCAAPVGRWLDDRGPRLMMTAGSVAATLLLLALSQVSDPVRVLRRLGADRRGDVGGAVRAGLRGCDGLVRASADPALTAVTLMAGFASTIFMPIEAG